MSIEKKEPFYKIKGKEVLLKDTIDMQKDCWEKEGMLIISLVGLKKIADKEEIVEKRFRTEITPSMDNKQQHAVNIWLGFRGSKDEDDWVRGSGEASMLNTGKVITQEGERRYEEYSEIDSQFRFAMAEKRAFSRALLKMIKLFNVYGEVEARDFRKSKEQENETGFDY